MIVIVESGARHIKHFASRVCSFEIAARFQILDSFNPTPSFSWLGIRTYEYPTTGLNRGAFKYIAALNPAAGFWCSCNHQHFMGI